MDARGLAMTQENSESALEATQGGEAAGGKTTPSLGWAEASIWTERMKSALGNGVKGGKWFSLMDKVYRPSTLEAAWLKARANKGSPGIDGQSLERFATGARLYLTELHESLKSGFTAPCRSSASISPKATVRPVRWGYRSVKDRIVQTALKMAIEPIFETQFREGSYGFRPGRGCKDALREVDRLLKEGYAHVVDADLKSYFDTIPHDRLMARVAEKISDGRVLALIQDFLRQDIMKGLERWTPCDGNAARGRDLSAAGEHLSASARSADGGSGISDGSLCGRLRDLVWDGGGGGDGAAPDNGVDG